MNAADVIVLLTMLKKWWDNHGTKILGTALGIVSGVLALPWIEPGTFRKVLEVSAIVLSALVVNRGFTNSNVAPKS